MEKSGIQNFECFSDQATRWLKSFDLYAEGKGLITEDATDATKPRRRALLLHFAGPDVQDIFSTLENTGEVTDYDAAVTALNTYFMPQVNAAFARQAFHKLNQKTGEMIQQFATRLRRAAKDCGFQADIVNQIRDAILSKCTSDYVRRKVEEGPTLTLARSIELASQCERIEEQISVISLRPDTGAVNQVVQKRDKERKEIKDTPETSMQRER